MVRFGILPHSGCDPAGSLREHAAPSFFEPNVLIAPGNSQLVKSPDYVNHEGFGCYRLV